MQKSIDDIDVDVAKYDQSIAKVSGIVKVEKKCSSRQTVSLTRVNLLRKLDRF